MRVSGAPGETTTVRREGPRPLAVCFPEALRLVLCVCVAWRATLFSEPHVCGVHCTAHDKVCLRVLAS